MLLLKELSNSNNLGGCFFIKGLKVSLWPTWLPYRRLVCRGVHWIFFVYNAPSARVQQKDNADGDRPISGGLNNVFVKGSKRKNSKLMIMGKKIVEYIDIEQAKPEFKIVNYTLSLLLK